MSRDVNWFSVPHHMTVCIRMHPYMAYSHVSTWTNTCLLSSSKPCSLSYQRLGGWASAQQCAFLTIFYVIKIKPECCTWNRERIAATNARKPVCPMPSRERAELLCVAGAAASYSGTDWLMFEVTQPVMEKLSSSSDKMLPNKATITVPELTLRLTCYTCSLKSFGMVQAFAGHHNVLWHLSRVSDQLSDVVASTIIVAPYTTAHFCKICLGISSRSQAQVLTCCTKARRSTECSGMSVASCLCTCQSQLYCLTFSCQ